MIDGRRSGEAPDSECPANAAEREGRARAWWGSVGDRALVEALRAGRAAAVDEFIRRFEDVAQRYARSLGLSRPERQHWAGEVLYAVALTLARGRGPIPGHLGFYVAGACKHKARREREQDAVYAARVRESLDDVSGSGEYASLGTTSEASVRLARGIDWEPHPLPPVLKRLVSAFDEAITADERQLLGWLGEYTSYSTIAAWLGISRPAAVSRIQRLRNRLVEVAFRFGASLNGADLSELVRFLRRTGAVEETRLLELERLHGEQSQLQRKGGPR
jgi:hypothetical protein